MAEKPRRAKLVLSAAELQRLRQVSQSRTAPQREVLRAQILRRYHAGEPIAVISRTLGMTRKSVGKWIDKALAMGTAAALVDSFHRPRAPVITE